MEQGLLSSCGEKNDGPTRLAAAFRLQNIKQKYNRIQYFAAKRY